MTTKPEPEKENIEEPVEDEVVEQETSTADTQDKTGEKKFTQADLNKHVQTRLKRETSKWETEREGYLTDIEFYEQQMETIISAQTSDWDAGMKELFNALPVRERLEKLANGDFMAKVRRKNVIPKTPKESGEPNNSSFARRNKI